MLGTRKVVVALETARECSAISERDRLQYFLDQQRNAVLAIMEGLDDVQLNTPVLPSG